MAMFRLICLYAIFVNGWYIILGSMFDKLIYERKRKMCL